MVEKEIERKWLVKSSKEQIEEVLKHYNLKRYGELRQAYIIDKPVEVRLRHMMYADGEIYFNLDCKIGRGLARTEISNRITKEEYNNILKDIGKPETVKDYRRYEVGKYTLEYSDVDDFTMAYMEIEFGSEEEANSFKLPEDLDRLCKEVKDGYSMQDYWRETRGFD